MSIRQAEEGEEEEEEEEDGGETLSTCQQNNRPMTDLASGPVQPNPTNPNTNILQQRGTEVEKLQIIIEEGAFSTET
ncbi:Hypothetical predicted protein [Scomber scombrus]|uniref:Uncharacterized protein n=1 Tax=Scomber scombrus TaxID=13677 RepID=A0AAV1NSB3_SCOSC